MTIGIAASGPWAGAGILAGLRAVEAVGRGAIGGFVSMAVLTDNQNLVRAETQSGGAHALFNKLPEDVILGAPYAALISSGPNRPPPLSQFVAAEPGVGLVTGHRFPHMVTESGKGLNALVLESMKQGVSAQSAIDALISTHPGYDAGFIALSTSGDLGLGNMPSVLRLSNHGGAITNCPETGAQVATLFNAIQPGQAITTIANEMVLDEIRRRCTKVQSITLNVGTRLTIGDASEIHVDEKFHATCITYPGTLSHNGGGCFGIGDKVKVFQIGKQIGWLGAEPFMIVADGAIVSMDGQSEIQLPVNVHESL